MHKCAACEGGDCVKHFGQLNGFAGLQKADPKPEPEELQELIDLRLDWEDLIPELAPYLEGEAAEGVREALIRFGFPQAKDEALWNTVLKQAQEVARQRAAELVGKRVQADGTIIDNPNAEWAITEATRAALHDLASKAIDEGWTNTQLQHEIIADHAFSPSRALTIARTEKSYARNHGEHQAAKGVGMKFKSWLTAGETCDECQENAGQGRIGIDDEFASGDDAPPAHPNCRCSAGYYETEDGD